MPNPYAANRRVSLAAESEPARDHLTRRLHAIGATPDEIAALREGWDQLDDSWTAADRHHLVRTTDTELARRLAEVRDEYHVGTTDQADDDAVIDHRRAQTALADARERIGSTINSLVEWVGTDRARALAVLSAEDETNNPRPRLVRRLEELTR